MTKLNFHYSIYTLLLVLWSFSSCKGQSKSDPKSPYSKEIADQIQLVENNLSGRILINGKGENILERMAYYNIKGLSIAVVNNYEVVWAKGYGWADENEDRPVTTETLFKSGSISKSLNAVGVLKLVQDKKLNLYTDINDYLSSWKFPYDSLSKEKKINLSHLLSHTGGLSMEGGFLGYKNQSDIPSIPQILDGKGTTPAVRSLFEPGLQFEYSGGGTLISQLIITDVTRQSYENYMHDYVLEPLGMSHSYYSVSPPSKEQLKKTAKGYTYNGFEVEYFSNYFPEQAPLGLWTTATDLCKYITETQLAFKGKSAKVLNQEMIRLQLTPTLGDMAALGVFIEERGGIKYFHHDGRHGGFCGIFYGSIEGGKGVAICINSDDNRIFDEILNSVATVYDWKGFYNSVNKNVITVPDSVLEKYAGVYHYENKLANIFKKPDGYYFWAGGINSGKMYFPSEKEFFSQESTTDKTFVFDNNGSVLGYVRKREGKVFPISIKIKNPDTLNASPDEIIELTWHLLENKQVSDALRYMKRCTSLNPENKNSIIPLAHCYLFNNEFEKAIKLYKQCLIENKNDTETIKYHFLWFKKYGYDSKTMDKAYTELKL